jgi:hypothetical protein
MNKTQRARPIVQAAGGALEQLRALLAARSYINF